MLIIGHYSHWLIQTKLKGDGLINLLVDESLITIVRRQSNRHFDMLTLGKKRPTCKVDFPTHYMIIKSWSSAHLLTINYGKKIKVHVFTFKKLKFVHTWNISFSLNIKLHVSNRYNQLVILFSSLGILSMDAINRYTKLINFACSCIWNHIFLTVYKKKEYIYCMSI
jgi:hypothetical protein